MKGLLSSQHTILLWCCYMQVWFVCELIVPNALACGSSPASEKTRPRESRTMYLVYFLTFATFSLVCPISVPAALRQSHCMFCVLLIILTFGLLCPIRVPAVPRWPQKKNYPWSSEHVSIVFWGFVFQLVLIFILVVFCNLFLPFSATDHQMSWRHWLV